jgi:hypothetical protein
MGKLRGEPEARRGRHVPNPPRIDEGVLIDNRMGLNFRRLNNS